MIQEKPLSISDITQELNAGTATIKFIVKRFSQWLPSDRMEGNLYYPRTCIPVLIRIKESLDAGMLPSEIDQELENPVQENCDPKTENHFIAQPNEDIRVSKDGLGLIKSLFDDIAIQQNRVATAHEKRAAAEERKAIAIEKRAEAEEKKAIAMNNIAAALQEMSQHRPHDHQAREMALQAVEVLAINETNTEIDLPDTQQQDMSDIFDSPDPFFDLLEPDDIEDDTEMDDLSDLTGEETALDDLSDLIEKKLDLDDLSTLLDDPGPQPDDMDDLASLIDGVSSQPSPEPAPLLDDLSLLISETASPAPPLDDLSLLISPQVIQVPVEIDDLSLLIEPEPLEPVSQTSMDDLSALVSETSSLKPDITPEQNLAEYKAAVMKTILHLKTQGLNAEETTLRLNQDGVQTISGKSQWSEKAILQIYKFIDSAK